jgi:exodeoxyribonuclease VII large subunit
MPITDESSRRFDFERDIYTVSRLNGEARQVLEGSFPLLWVEGEISNLALPSSGHAYFSLKDAYAQVRCAMFRMQRSRLRFKPANGMQVLARVRVGLYEGRGEFQLVVEHLEPAGEGALRQAFERLKQALAAEGLFDVSRKQALPAFPRCVGVITSPTGAAIRDVLSTLCRRQPGLPVVLYPVAVQGDGAAAEIVAALRLAQRRAECDVLLLVRGGGSLEDLMAFNDEALAREVARCALPIVCGVGHEIDFCMVDFVADCRAATPTAAAELVSADQREWRQRLDMLSQRASLALQRQLHVREARLQGLRHRLQQARPARRVVQQQQRVDELEMRLRASLAHRLDDWRGGVQTLAARLHGQTPMHKLAQRRLRLHDAHLRLERALRRCLERAGERLARLATTLEVVGPLATLSRGYAIASAYPQGEVLHDAAQLSAGQQVLIRLGRGRLLCRVQSIIADDA